MRRVAALLFLGAVAAGCGNEEPAASDEVPSSSAEVAEVRLPDGFEPIGGEPFTIEVSPGRSPAWILSRGGERLFVMYDREESSPPHYFSLGSTLSVPSVAVLEPTETLVWPEDLGRGDYELCNYGRDDWCVTITVE